MTRAEMWEEFESQLKKEVHTPITMSYDDSIRLAELGIEETVARWKQRLEQETCEDCISRQAVIDSLHSKFADGFDTDSWWNSTSVLYAINKVPYVKPQEPKTDGDCISRQDLLKKCVYVPIAPLIAGEKVYCEKVVFAMDIIHAEPKPYKEGEE